MHKLKSFVTIIFGIGLFLSLLFCYYSYLLFIQPIETPQLPTFSQSSQWKLYQDPDGYFSLWIPKNWNVSKNGGPATISSPGFSAKYNSIMTNFSQPASPAEVSINVDEFGEGIEKSNCLLDTENNADNPNTTLAGLPSVYDDMFGWQITTTKAHYQISWSAQARQGGIALPELETSGGIMQQAEPQMTLNDYFSMGKDLGEKILGTYGSTEKEIIASFKPIPAIPSCKNYILP